MMKLILVAFLVITSLVTVFAADIHNYIGAVILGINVVTIDLFWQWLRMKLIGQLKTSNLWWGILGGLVVRVASIYLFMRVGLWWLGNGRINSTFYIFVIFLLTIPVWSIIFSFKFKPEGN